MNILTKKNNKSHLWVTSYCRTNCATRVRLVTTSQYIFTSYFLTYILLIVIQYLNTIALRVVMDRRPSRAKRHFIGH